MVRKFSGYIVLSVLSFGFFTAAFHAVAHAQTVTQQTPTPTPLPKVQTQSQMQETLETMQPDIPPVSPTPTIFVLVTVTPTSSPTPETSTAPKTNDTTSVTTITPSPTKTPTKTSPTPTVSLTPTPAPQAGGMNAEKLFSMINAHRQSKGLSVLQKDARTCSLAASRAPEIAAELAAGTLHSGMYARNLPYWNTENAIAIAPEETAFTWWLNDPIHRQAIEGNHTHSCVACSGNFCVQEFTSYQPK